MKDMNQGLVTWPELFIPDDLLKYMDDDNLDKIDPEILLSDISLPCDPEVESNRDVPAVTDCSHTGSPEKTTSTKQCTRKRPRENGKDTQTVSRPKRQRIKKGLGPEEVFLPPSPDTPLVQTLSPPLSPPPTCVIIRMVPTIRIPPFIRLPRDTRTIILVPISPRHEGHIPPLSPVNGTPAPVQLSSSPSGSLSDIPPVCSSPQSPEICPINESCASQAQDIPESVKDYILDTKAYISQACDDLGDGLTVTSNYVDTKVLLRDNGPSGKSSNKSLDIELNVMGETDRKKCMVALKQVFERRQGSRSKSYNLLVGKAGMGKSSCIKKLCLDWSKDYIPQFDFVFLLDGRLLTITEPAYSLQTLLLSLSSFAPPCLDPDAVFAQILASSKRVLLIFDGFEDLRDFELLIQPFEKDIAKCLQKDKKANTFTVRQLFSAILQRVVLPGCTLLLASRPRGSARLLLRNMDSVLEVCGFSSLEVETYVKCYFSSPEVQSAAINCLEKCCYLRLLCWNPGICRLVCFILQRQTNLETLPRTLTGVCYQVLQMKLESDCKSREEAQSEHLIKKGVMCNAAQTTSKSQVCTRQRASRSRKTHRKTSTTKREEKGLLSELSSIAWETVKSSSFKISSKFSVSVKAREAGLTSGLLNATVVGRRQVVSSKTDNNMEEKDTTGDDTTSGKGVCGHEILSWANPFLHSYLAAVHLTLSSAALVKTLSFQTTSRVCRRSQREEFELTQRFAFSLLFQNLSELLWLHPTNNENFNDTVVSKQNTLLDHLRHLQFGHLGPSHILDLCHFVYEGSYANCGSTKGSSCSLLASHLVKNLPEKLTFNSVQLSPADVYVIKNIVENSGMKEKSFSLDVEESGIQVSGLRSLVEVDAVSTYRACIADVVALWEELEKRKEDCHLHNVVSKFKIDPFKATHVRHVEHLAKLVDIHRTKTCSESQSNSIFAEGVPAIKDLHILELQLGPEKGPLALPMLWEMLPGLHNLENMDLENNKIGEDGAQHLAKALVSLSSLETLNLSQNSIGDHGGKTLAAALRNLPKLARLSLQDNDISDEGACSFAAVLPYMAALSELDIRHNKFTDVGAQSLGRSLKQCGHMKSLRMWNKYIPYGVFERLKQQDHRIKETELDAVLSLSEEKSEK